MHPLKTNKSILSPKFWKKMSDELFNIGTLSAELSLLKNCFSARTILGLSVYRRGFYIQNTGNCLRTSCLILGYHVRFNIDFIMALGGK